MDCWECGSTYTFQEQEAGKGREEVQVSPRVLTDA